MTAAAPAPEPPIADLVRRNALFVVNHSGGKDSQAMLAVVRSKVPASQIVVAHAHLPGVEWEGVIPHIYRTIGDLPLHVVQAGKTFFDMVEHRRMFPSPKHRQCTSDLKRGPIEKLIRRLCVERGCGLVVNCMGMRAEESPSRRELKTWRYSERNSLMPRKARKPAKSGKPQKPRLGREWYDWLPIHDMLVDEVFATIRRVRQEPHWAYAAGMTRLSCCFCIMASSADLKTAARLKPDLYKRYVETEKRLGFTLRMDGRGLEDVTGIAVQDQLARVAA